MPIETYAYTADIVQIDKIEFCVFGNDEVKRYSVINDQLGINIPEAYDNGEPKQGGLIDKRLGVSDYHIVCDTCGLTTNDCPGHFGHIELAEEVFHYGYLDTVKNILNCICLNCSKLLISKNRDEMMEIVDNSIGKIRFAKIKKLTSNVKFCQYPDNGCGKPVAKISKAGPLQLMATYVSDAKQEDGNGQASTGLKKKKNTEILTPSRVYNILKNIDDMDCRLMGFDPKKNRPEYFIIKYFPVPPVAIRPSVRLESSAGPSGDSLTSKLADIVKDNIKLRKQKDRSLITGEESKYNQDYLQVLQYDIATYYDNDSTLPKSDQKGGKSFKSISERLEGKTGRIRGNLMGKRVDFSARTVITSDPNISLDELGVPIKIVTNITFPEIVTPFNIDKLSKLVRNGRDIYPGANFVYPLQSLESGKKSKIDLRYRKKSVKLHYGDIVERHIIDGDPVLFNRQPTLHKMSMMCHKVKVIMDESLYTFRLNVSVTTPYNADFDGDEMNMFIPQTIQTQLELSNIADVKKMIIGPRLSIPIIKFVQDTLLGSYRMTDAIRTLDYHDAMNLAMYCKNVDIFKLRKETINTHNLYSLIIPDMINYSSGKANITNGNLINGTVDKSIINDKIVYYTWDRHGHEITRNFFDNAQRLVTNWFLINGSTVGYGDAIIEKNVSDDVASIFETKKMEVDTLITEMENNPDMLNPELFENKIKSKLESSVGEITTKVYDHLKKNNPDNNFYLMVESGAKGSKGNVSRIIGGTCQSILEFSRIKKKVNNRTLPHFFQNDDRAVARGYSTSSFYTGLDPKEFFFLHMAGRSGLIDTAIKSITGDTPIVIMVNNVIKHINIGDWIDHLLENNSELIEHETDNNDNKYEHRELLKLRDETFIPTTDADGKVSWGQITAITRHNPGQQLYEIKTHGGRKVTVTDSHSLLIWNGTRFDRVKPEDVQIGNYVPVTAELVKPNYDSECIREQGIDFKFNSENGLLLGKYLMDGIIVNKLISEYSELFGNMIHPECFNGSDEFIKGLINGIFSEAGIIENTIQLKTTSERLLNDINICLSRLNIFGEISELESTAYCLTVHSKWVNILRNIIGLETIILSDRDENINFKQVNNVVLDPITEINKIDPTLYQKVYDVTVPTTLNFSLANGLHIVDTADSGYISRKMIKGMEDVHLTYDKTVRSGNNVIIQMLYGDNNIGQVHYKENEIKIVNMSNTDINNKFGFSDEETKKMIKEFKLNKSEFDKFNGDYCSYICNLRDELRDIQMKVRFDKITMMDKYMLPVNLSRIVNDAKNISDKSKSESLNPYYVSHVIKQILRPSITNINLMDENSNGFKYNDQDRGKYLFKIALYEYLSPKRCIFEYKLSKYQFDQMIIEILKSFKKACVEPGEMVGVLTAQTLGEISTQMSLHANSTIFLKAENKSTRKTKIIRTKIGKFIELLYKKFPDRIKNIPGHNDSTEFSLDNFTYDYCICGVSQDEKVRWNKISHLSKHPTNGNLLKIKTLSGRTVISTKSHNFLKRTANDGIIAVTSDNLKISDRIPVARKIEYKSNNEEFDINGQVLKLNEETALSFGLQSDDYLNNDIFFEFVHNANLKFVSTLLRTYFDNNSDIILDQNIIRVYFKSTELMKCISMLLPYFGIFGTIYEESCTIEISHEYVKIFLECIGTDIQQKREDMEKIGIFSDSKCEYDKIPELGHIIARLGNDLRLSDNLDTYEPIERHTLVKYIEIFYDKYNEIQSTLDPNMRQNIKSDIDYLKMISLGDVIWDEIVEITEMDDPKEYVYDFTIPGNETFMVNEGILVHNTLNTFHQAGTGVVGMRGIPRFKEIISYTKKMQTPSMMIKLTPEVRSNQVIAHKIEASLRHTIFGNIIDKMDIIYDPFVTMPEKDGLDRKNIYYTHTSNISLENLPWLYRFTFNRDSLLEYDVKLLDIKTKLIKYWTEYLSDTNIAKKKLIVSKVINGCIMSNYDNSENPIIHIRYDVFNPDNNSLIDIGQYMINKISIKGVEAIQSVDSLDKKKVIEYDEDQGIKSNTYEWIIYTNGIDLNKAKTIKYIDFNSTYINDIYMSYLNFGIEAARSSIIRECDDLFSSGGNPINITHISFLADVMTNTGNITSIDRHGLNRLDTDPLSRASFENTVTQLINAAAFNEVDHVRSVSSRIMAGRCIKGGTGLCDVLMDNDIIENSEFTKQTKTYSKDIKIQVEENRLIKHMLSKNFVEPDIYIP
jgi:DNA-directed RNA polymerase beta' subunit